MTSTAGRRAGGRDEFIAAYPGLFLPALRLAYRMTADREVAEDLAAEALARTYARWAAVSRLDSPQAWVLKVTTNLAVDAVRRQKVAQRTLPKLVVPEHGGQFEDSTAARLTLVTALAALPRRQREVIALHYLAGLGDDDVARALNIAASSVRTHLQRGLARLRQHLNAQGEVAHVAV